MGSNFMSSISTLGWGVIGYVIPFLFVLTVVVFFHELGHFLVARWNGVRVLVFSIGFGPRTVRLQRPARNALEALRDPARRLCQVLRR